MTHTTPDIGMQASARGCDAPLSFGQQCVLLNQSLAAPGALNLRCSVPLRPAPSDDGPVRQLLRLLQLRNDAFRSRLVRRGRRTAFEFLDLEDAPEIELLSGALDDPRGWASAPFPRGTAPLVRARLRERAGSATLHLVVDHLVFDGWSGALLADEVARIWESVTTGADAGSPPGSYQAYLASQQQYRAPGALAAYRSFWQQQFERDTHLRLPTRAASGCHRLSFPVPPQVSDALPRLRRDFRTTDFTIFLAAFATALARSAAQGSVLVHSAVADREQRGAPETIGCLLNFVAVRVDVGHTFEETVVSTRTGLMNALSHQSGPFFELTKAAVEPDLAVVFAQPRLYGNDEWRPPEGAEAAWDLGESSPLTYGDISFGFRTAPWGYAAGFSFEDRFLSTEDAHDLARGFLGVLASGTGRREGSGGLQPDAL